MSDHKKLGIYTFKSVTENGNPARHIFTIGDNGAVYINQFIFSKETNIPGMEPLFTRMGRTLHRTIIGMSYTSINTIHTKLTQTLNEKKIIPFELRK